MPIAPNEFSQRDYQYTKTTAVRKYPTNNGLIRFDYQELHFSFIFEILKLHLNKSFELFGYKSFLLYVDV